MFLVQAVATFIVVCCFAGVNLIQIVTNNPSHWVPDPATGHTCAVIVFGYPNYHNFYYAIPFDCSVSWTLWGAGVIALAVGLFCKFAR